MVSRPLQVQIFSNGYSFTSMKSVVPTFLRICWPPNSYINLWISPKSSWTCFKRYVVDVRMTDKKNRRLQEGMAVGSYDADVNLWPWLVAFCQNQAWRFLHICLLSDQMHLAKTWPGHPDRIWASLAQYDPGLLRKKRTESDQAYTLQPDYGCTLAVMAITGYNQNASKSDLAFYWAITTQ